MKPLGAPLVTQVIEPAPSAPKLWATVPLVFCASTSSPTPPGLPLARVSSSSFTSMLPAVGASSLKLMALPRLRLVLVESPSLSVMVATSFTRSAADRPVAWSGPLSGVCRRASFWSRVTLPTLSTVTVKATAPPLPPTRPTTWPLSR